MKIKVHEQEKTFYLAAESWVPMTGNEIEIGKHRFCATPHGNAMRSTIVFSEVTSGAKLTEVELDFFDAVAMDTKSKYLELLNKAAHGIAYQLSKRSDLDDEVLKMEYIAISKLGPKPPTTDIDLE